MILSSERNIYIFSKSTSYKYEIRILFINTSFLSIEILLSFLGPRGPLRIPSFVRPPVFPQEKSKSQLKPYRSSQDHVRPLI